MKGILFKEVMVKAVMQDIKRNTRRIMKDVKPRYNVGEIIYVKEPHSVFKDLLGQEKVVYKYDLPQNLVKVSKPTKWSNPMFSGQKYARLYLQIESIEVQNLHDISEQDAELEGAVYWAENVWPHQIKVAVIRQELKDYITSRASVSQCDKIELFRLLWESINGKDSWLQNPKVFSYKFKRVEKPVS